MTEDRHAEIAARLHDEGMARAPQNLRAEVMHQVRAEPRRRPVRPRHRRPLPRPILSLAAAACILAAAVFGVSHLSGSGSDATVAGGGAAGASSSRTPSLEAAGPNATTASPPAGPTRVNSPHEQTIYRAAAGTWLARTPLPLRRAYALRAALATSLPRALEPYGPTGRGTNNR
jgi:negative regulator of sigma E activity